MGRSVNKVTIIGTLGQDPEMKFMPNNTAVVNLSVATDESYTSKETGQKTEVTEWHRITAYGKLAEIIDQYLKKGSKAYFEGKLKTREWEKDGVKRYTTEIIASEMTMLDSKKDDTQGQQQAPAQQPQKNYQAPQQQSPQQQGLGYWNSNGTPCQPNAVQQFQKNNIPMWVYGQSVPPVNVQIQGWT